MIENLEAERLRSEARAAAIEIDKLRSECEAARAVEAEAIDTADTQADAIRTMTRALEAQDAEIERLRAANRSFAEGALETEADKDQIGEFVDVIKVLARELGEKNAALDAAIARLETLGASADGDSLRANYIKRDALIVFCARIGQGRYRQSGDVADALADVVEFVSDRGPR